MKINKKIAIMFSTVAAISLLAGCGSNTPKAEKKAALTTLHVATNATYVPFEFKNEKEKGYQGYEIEVVKAVAKELGKKPEFQNIPFSGLIPALQAGDVDMAASGMTITKKRGEKVLFAAPFYASRQVILTKKDSGIKTPEDLKGHQVALQMGTVSAKYAADHGLKMKQFDHNAEALMELEIGGSDAVLLDKPVADYFITTNSKKGKNDVIVIDIPEAQKEYFGFAFNHDNKELQKSVNEALAKLTANGELNKIYKKWFSTDMDTFPKTAEETF
jgi:polar amino acid transport system substrate-binding protein